MEGNRPTFHGKPVVWVDQIPADSILLLPVSKGHPMTTTLSPTESDHIDFDKIRREWSPGIAELLIEAALAAKADKIATQQRDRRESIARLRTNRHFHDFGRDRCCNNCGMSMLEYHGERRDLDDGPCTGATE